jgi:hypothetical protein
MDDDTVKALRKRGYSQKKIRAILDDLRRARDAPS